LAPSHRDDTERLSRVFQTQREIAAAGNDLAEMTRIVLDRSRAITGAEGAMLCLVEGDDLVTRDAVGIAATAPPRRPIATSVAKHAIETGQPLLIEDCLNDPRLNREMQRVIGDTSLICIPLFQGPRVIGVINVMSSENGKQLTEEDRQTMEMLSVVLSAAVSHVAEYEARRAETEALSRFNALFDGASIGIVRSNSDGDVVDVNPAVEEMFGYPADEMVGVSFRNFMHQDDLEQSIARFERMMAGELDTYQFERRYHRKDGKIVWGQTTAVLERDADGNPSFVHSMIENITERKLAEQALVRQSELNQHQALHDALTGLANRTLFNERIEQAIREAAREGSQVAVLVMDLDNFKEVNDSLGHHAGDVLLAELGSRVGGAVRAVDTVARLGGDEFGILLRKAEGREETIPAIERICQAVEQPVTVQGLPLSVEASIGVALYPDDGRDVDALLQRADVAMYGAKESNSSYVFYDEAHDHRDPTRVMLVGELRRAIEERELVLFYQPKARLGSGEIESVEALLRWQHPERGLIFPDAFIPLAQQTGLIVPLTLRVVDEALEQARRFLDRGMRLPIAVNLSTRNLMDQDFPTQVEQLLERWNVDAGMLKFELTESTMIADPVRTRDVIERLSALGIELSIDDFGTGYSCLAYLKRLPVSEIKIDRSFVMDMASSDDSATIVRSIIDLGGNLGLSVVAEGVETQEIWDELDALGCPIAQGYHLSRPIPADALVEWLGDRGFPGSVAAA
jgi:diguanylate cyclase (GGDEF)-like protein/PAS domain S-box-containing protein